MFGFGELGGEEIGDGVNVGPDDVDSGVRVLFEGDGDGVPFFYHTGFGFFDDEFFGGCFADFD